MHSTWDNLCLADFSQPDAMHTEVVILLVILLVYMMAPAAVRSLMN